MPTASILGILALGIAGVVSVGALFVLWHQKTVVDSNGQVVQVDIPFFGRMKTNVPAIAGLFIGAALVVFVVDRWTVPPHTIPLSATIRLEQPDSSVQRDVFVGVAPPEHYRTVRVSPNRAEVVEFPIQKRTEGGLSHFGVAYTVTHIDEDGFAHRIVQAGNLRFENGGRRALFDAVLPIARAD